MVVKSDSEFCPDEWLYMFERAVGDYRSDELSQPRCHTHEMLAKMRVPKDQMKDSSGRSYFVCAAGNNSCSFWQWEVCQTAPHRFASQFEMSNKESHHKWEEQRS